MPEASLDTNQSNATQTSGSGTRYHYGDNTLSLDATEQRSRIQQQSIDCRRVTYLIETDCRAIAPGTKFTLTDHPDDSRNGDYLIIKVLEMSGNQRQAQLKNFSGNVIEGNEEKTKTFFAKLKAIKVGNPYRTLLLPRPLVQGTFNAVVESTGGDYAYIDEQGRYRIRLGFDIGDAPEGEASHPVRMAQAYTGKDYGIHFPLHKNTEVVVSCINGDINRPIILGTVPNPDNHSPVTLNNNYENIIRTFGGNELEMDDTIDKEKIDLFTRDKKNILTLDATKDNHKVRLATEQGAMEIKAAKTLMVESEDSQFVKCGKDHSIFVENRQRLMTKNKEIRQTAKTDIVKKAGQNINWNSETENSEITVGNDMIMDVENNCSFEVKNKDMSFKITGGKFEVEAAKAITLKGDGGGPISFKQSGAKIEMATSGAIDIEGTTVSIDATSIMLKGGMFNHNPGGGASGHSGSADFVQSEIEKYVGFKFNPNGSASPQSGTPIDIAFTVMNFKGNEAVKIKIYEFDKNGLKDLVDTVNTTLKTGSGQYKVTWVRSAQQANQDLAQDQAAGDTGPLEYKFEVEVTGSKVTKMSGGLNLTKTITVDLNKKTGEVLTEGQAYELESTVQNGLVTFKDVIVGPIKIYSSNEA